MATERGDKVNFVRARIAEGITDVAEIIRLAKRDGMKLNPSSIYSERAVMKGSAPKPRSNGHATTRTQEPVAAAGGSRLPDDVALHDVALHLAMFVRSIVKAEMREAMKAERESLISRIAGTDRQLTIPHS